MVSISALVNLDCHLPGEVAARLEECQDKLVVMPSAATEALALVKGGTCSVAEVAATIERDVKLTSSVLALANSIVYSPGRPVAAARDAIITVGFRQCQNLIQTCCLTSLMKGMEAGSEGSRQALVHHSLVTAVAAVELNKLLGLDFEGEEFTAGLLHDIGRLLCATMYPELCEQFEAVSSSDEPALLQLERDLLGTDHTVLGCSFALAQRFPQELAEVVRFHHSAERASVAPKLCALTALADYLSTRVWLSEPHPTEWDLTPMASTIEFLGGAGAQVKLEAKVDAVLESALQQAQALAS